LVYSIYDEKEHKNWGLTQYEFGFSLASSLLVKIPLLKIDIGGCITNNFCVCMFFSKTQYKNFRGNNNSKLNSFSHTHHLIMLLGGQQNHPSAKHTTNKF